MQMRRENHIYYVPHIPHIYLNVYIYILKYIHVNIYLFRHGLTLHSATYSQFIIVT